MTVVSLTIGISVNAALFSLISQLYLRKLPIDRPEEVVRVFAVEPEHGERRRLTLDELSQVEEAAHALEKVAAYAPIGEVTLSGAGSARRVSAVFADDRYFDLLGVRPHRGVFFEAGGEAAGAVAIVSHDLWTALGGEARLLPSNIEVNGLPFTVLGVAPPGFKGVEQLGSPAILWMLMRRDGTLPVSRGPDRLPIVEMLGRRASASGAAVLEAQLDAISERLPRSAADRNGSRRLMAVEAQSAARQIVGTAHSAASIPILAATSILVFVLACLNVSTLLLAQNAARKQEYVTRLALGGGPGRVLRQSFAESLVVSLAAALLALPLGLLVLRAIWSLRPPLMDVRSLSIGIGTKEVLVVLAISAATACLLAAISASQTLALTRTFAQGEWSQGARATSGHRTGAVLVALQVAAATVVGVCATLSVASLARLNAIDTGFDASRLWLWGVDLDANQLDADQDRLYLKRLLHEARTAGGVGSAALSNTFFGMSIHAPITIDEQPDRDPPTVAVNGVSAGYFETMGIELLGGRDFLEADAASAQPVVIVSRSFADRVWPGRSALGLRLSYLGKSREVVGVVEDAKTRLLTEEDSSAVFHPFEQEPFPIAHLNVRFLERSPKAVAALARALEPLDPAQALAPSSLIDWVRGSLWGERVAAWLLAVLSGIGLVLASIGGYGVVSSWVNQRLPELGVRRALGAENRQIAILVLRRGLSSVTAGAAAGLAGAWVLSRVMKSFLYGIQPHAPGAYSFVVFVVLLCGVLSCLDPVRRALRIDAGSLLRSE